MKYFLISLLTFTFIYSQEDGEVVKDVTAEQRTDGSKIIDIEYDLEGLDIYATYDISVMVEWPDVEHTFYLSNFNKAAILTCDFKGEYQCTTWGIGFNNKIKILKSQNVPNSLGMFYATLTSILGYKPDSDEWKVMAMSGYNYDCKEYITKLRKTYKLLKNGELELIAKYFSYFNQGSFNSLYTKELMNLLNQILNLQLWSLNNSTHYYCLHPYIILQLNQHFLFET